MLPFLNKDIIIIIIIIIIIYDDAKLFYDEMMPNPGGAPILPHESSNKGSIAENNSSIL